MKTLVLTATSIICILSISTFADAKDRGTDGKSKSQLNLITKQQNSSVINSIPSADLKGIEQAILKRYQRLNKGPSYPSASGGAGFLEVKKMTLTSFSIINDGRAGEYMAEVEIIENSRSYGFEVRNAIVVKQKAALGGKYEYDFVPSNYNFITNRKVNLRVNKSNGKWSAE
jgi:hypothetical protein